MSDGHRHLIVAIGGCLALLFAASVEAKAGQPVQERPQASVGGQDHARSRQREAPPAAPEAKAQENQKGAAQQPTNGTDEPPKWTDTIMAITAVIVAAFTGVLTWVGWEQWKLLRRSTEESAAAIEIARRTAEATSSVASGTVMTGAATAALANAAEQSAAVAAKTLALMQDTSKRQLRAYMTWDEVELAPFKDKPGVRAVVLRWKNTGQTPATKVRTHMSWEPFAGDLPDGFKFPEKLSDGSPSIGTDKTVDVHAEGISIDLVERAAGKQRRLFIWAAIEYEDVFGPPAHRSEIALEIQFFPMIDGIYPVLFVPLDRHNSST